MRSRRSSIGRAADPASHVVAHQNAAAAQPPSPDAVALSGAVSEQCGAAGEKGVDAAAVAALLRTVRRLAERSGGATLGGIERIKSVQRFKGCATFFTGDGIDLAAINACVKSLRNLVQTSELQDSVARVGSAAPRHRAAAAHAEWIGSAAARGGKLCARLLPRLDRCDDIVHITLGGALLLALLALLADARCSRCKTSALWIDVDMHLNETLEIIDASIREKRRHACIHALGYGALLAGVMVGAYSFILPPCVSYFSPGVPPPPTTRIGAWMGALANGAKKALSATPLVNEALIIVQVMLGAAVLIVVTGALHCTGITRWVLTLSADLKRYALFATQGDHVDNVTRRDIELKVRRLRDDVLQRVGNAPTLAAAKAHPKWEETRLEAVARREMIEGGARRQAARIAADVSHGIAERAEREKRAAIEGEGAYMDRVQFSAAAATHLVAGAMTGGASGLLSAGVHVALADGSAASTASSRPLSERRSFDARVEHPPLLGGGNEGGHDELHRLIGLGAVEDARRKSMRLTLGASGELQS